MAVRGSRFAKDQPARRDANGHSLASDGFLYYVAVELVCAVCARGGTITILAAWGIETDAPEFRSDRVFQIGGERAVELQEICDPDGTVRRRYKFRCRRCGQAPEFREERIDAALKSLYVQGVRAMTRRVPV